MIGALQHSSAYKLVIFLSTARRSKLYTSLFILLKFRLLIVKVVPLFFLHRMWLTWQYALTKTCLFCFFTLHMIHILYIYSLMLFMLYVISTFLGHFLVVFTLQEVCVLRTFFSYWHVACALYNPSFAVSILHSGFTLQILAFAVYEFHVACTMQNPHISEFTQHVAGTSHEF